MLRRIAFIFPALLLVGCSGKTVIKNAWVANASEGDSAIHVEISSKDAEFIKRNQVYFSIVLNECSGEGKRFPMEPMIGGKRASDFDFGISSDSVVDFVAIGPSWAIKNYHNPCVTLEGGGYAGARLKSNQVPLATREMR